MLNMDFNKRVVIDTLGVPWQTSPAAGVERKPLAREAAERGHATSIVRYAPGSGFAEHDHPLGEEILVLEGTFSDHTGDFPAGTYFRNPPGFVHAPFSEEGCVILVKLHQFSPDDDSRVAIDTTTAKWQPGQGNTAVLPLHRHGSERVALLQVPAGGPLRPGKTAGGEPSGEEIGEEIYVLSGELSDEYGRYSAGAWLRNPPGSFHNLRAEEDTVIWLKTGHLYKGENP